MNDPSVLHVTFDRSVSSKIRARSRKRLHVEDDYARLLKAIGEGWIRPYLSEATLTFELFSPDDRLLILASYFAHGEMRPAMPELNPGAQAWVNDLLPLGFRVLHAPPRVALAAWAAVGDAWAEDPRFSMGQRQERQCDLVEQFEHLGLPRLKELGETLARVHGLDRVPLQKQPYSCYPGLLWYNGLIAEHTEPRYCSSRADLFGKVRKIFSDWFDLDAVASHYGYGLDYFCTDDSGRGEPSETIFHPRNRQLLDQEFDVHILDPHELARLL